MKVVRDFDAMDDGDPTVPPQFAVSNAVVKCTQSIIKESMDRVQNLGYPLTKKDPVCSYSGFFLTYKNL